MSYRIALVTDRAGSFATLIERPVPYCLEDGRILVTTLATFDCQKEALAFLRGLQRIRRQARERTPDERASLERHGLLTEPQQAD